MGRKTQEFAVKARVVLGDKLGGGVACLQLAIGEIEGDLWPRHCRAP